MAVKWTEEQKKVITLRDRNILVSAAAGSGKTAVLVQRILSKIMDPLKPVDIDRLLIMTFTRAAAGEMRERIERGLDQALAEDPDNEHLQRQMTLIHTAQITTIDGFCAYVIRNYFHLIGLDPGYRTADEGELKLLQEDVLKELFEDHYAERKADFTAFVECYAPGKTDEGLKEHVLELYNAAMSNPWPEKWLDSCVENYHLDPEKGLEGTRWFRYLWEAADCALKEAEELTETAMKTCQLQDGPELYLEALEKDMILIRQLKQLSVKRDYDEIAQNLRNLKFARLSSKKMEGVSEQLKNLVKTLREDAKDNLKELGIRYFYGNLAELTELTEASAPPLEMLGKLPKDFAERFQAKKREKNVLDFSDMEHFALDILLKKEGETYVPSQAARELSEKYDEVLLDEYQDSNLVQEILMQTVSGWVNERKNIFMVGDVKQSIYKFRQAMPELFLNKYKTYKLKKEKSEADDLKIQLFKNFRSRKNILDTTNIIFQEIMSKDLGDVDYNEDEYLNLGANYEEPQLENIDFAGKTEINIINLEDTTKDIQEDEEDNVKTERIENSILEARYVAQKINELINSNYYVLDKKEGYRKVTYKDIVVLLRSTTELSPIYEKEISDLGMPVYSETSTEYLNSVEIQIIMSCLKIIDNPMQDIPLVTVMRSMIGGFTDNDLIEIRLADKYENFYESVVKSRIQVNEELRNKINSFLELINNWREESEFLALDELIWKIYMDTGYYNYVGLMQNGKLRQANLKMLFERAKQYESASFKGVFNFINFIDKLKLRNNDLGAAKIIGENENVIRIMSIHKSKGLEFPVVFLSSTGKNFNLKDLREKILIHQEIGFGPNYENSELKIEYPTIAKEAIKMISKRESISEEMRVLYVALTRAKEKLIITGIEKDLQKSIDSKEKELQIYESEDNSKINPKILESYKSYLDWIELVYLKNKIKNSDLFEFNIVSKAEILNASTEKEEERKDVLKDIKSKKTSKENIEKIKNILEWEYKYKDSTEMPSELSVSKIKELSKDRTEEKIGITLKKPNFLIGKTDLTPAEKGTIMHLCLQKLNYKEEYNLEKLKNMLSNLVNKEIILPKEAESVNYNKILAFLKSNIWKEMQTAKVVEQEKAFYLNLKANEIYKNNAEDEILVQGIIDLYYITKNDELVLVDYKTDYVENNNEQSLKDKYNIQLEIYKKALEEALNRNVDKVYIYSTWLNKEIEI